jgi:predicted nucleotide-binding protein
MWVAYISNLPYTSMIGGSASLRLPACSGDKLSCMSFSRVERDICKFVIRRFLDDGDTTPRRILLKEFKESLPDASRRLLDRSVLKSVEQNYGSETYLPRAVAFHYCGDAAVLRLAKKCMETVLPILRYFYEQELDKEPQDQREFIPVDVAVQAQKLYSDFDAKMTNLGLYLAEELGVFYTMQYDEKRVFVKSFRPSERIYEATRVSNPWDLHMERGRASVERDWNQEIKTQSVEVPSDKNILDAVNSFQIHTDPEISHKVFLVHGRAEEPKQAVAAFLRSLGLEVVILHEQANQGRTIIEKFEKHSAVGFAVVLLTPDDVGASADHPEKSQRRARQNVILELGFFIAKLGRKRVCPIYVEGVELPSDYHGVLYVPYDEGGTWRSKLVTELSAAGIKMKNSDSPSVVPLTKRQITV